MIRVLHVLCDLSPGGAERLVLELCRRHAPDIAPNVATVQGLGALEPAFASAGFPVVAGGRRRRALGLGAIARLRTLMRDVDIVHTHLFAGDTWGRIAARTLRHGPIVVTTEHNVNRDETWQVHVKRMLAPGSTLVAVSEAVARHAALVEGIGPMRVIPNGVDLGRFGAHRGSDGTRVLAIGRRTPQKGFDVLVDALPEGMTLDIAGEGLWTTSHPRVRLLGRREDIPELLANTDVLAVPSRWEGYGLAAAEGLAAGVPVVASDVDGLREVVGDAGLLVPPEDPRALHAALVALRDDSALRTALGARARRRAAERLDISDTIRAYEALYREQVRARTPRVRT